MSFTFKEKCEARWELLRTRVRMFVRSCTQKNCAPMLVRHRRVFLRVGVAAVLLYVSANVAYAILFSAPINHPAPIIVRVASSETVGDIAWQFQQEHLVRYGFVLRALLRVDGGAAHVQSGAYFFSEPQNVFTVARRLARGEHDVAPVRITVPEGATVREIGDILARRLAPFDLSSFLADASTREGFLYPDTYYFYPAQNADEVERAMEDNFYRKISAAQDAIASSGKPLQQVITMASIVAAEARTEADRRAVAGILWKRMSIGMPLQVDAPFGYVLDKPLNDLTHADIATDSPYNTYHNKGLPPTPIGSPTISAILAAAEPLQTSFLYYLSDGVGVMHYSNTYDQHKALVQKYFE